MPFRSNYLYYRQKTAGTKMTFFGFSPRKAELLHRLGSNLADRWGQKVCYTPPNLNPNRSILGDFWSENLKNQYLLRLCGPAGAISSTDIPAIHSVCGQL